MIHLECPHCRETTKVTEWNKNSGDAITLNLLDAPIPEFETEEEWENYRRENEGGRIDCPNCSEPCCIADMDAY